MTGTFVLRNYPDDDALKHPEKYCKSLSFSPDIIPLYGTKADKDKLTSDASWRGFTGMPIVGGDVNNVYIRGHGSGGPYVASLKVVPSELILWPHVWHKETPVASGPVIIPGGESTGPYASDGPLQFRPPHTTGNTYSLVAHVYEHVPNKQVPPPSFDLDHFGVDEFIAFLNKDKEHTFYNVIVADPTLKYVSATTRLRMIGKSPVWVGFHIDWHNGTAVPEGLEVSLSDDRGVIAIPRTQLSSFKEHKVQLDPSYDGILMLNIFAPADKALFEPYSGLSLQVYKSDPVSIGFRSLLGALNVIFEPHATRNIRFASHTARQLRESQNTAEHEDPKVDTVLEGDCGPIPVTKPVATGWWGRSRILDQNHFPHRGPFGYSPDIQPIGSNLDARDFLTLLSDPKRDYATNNKVELVGNRDNYVYVRGHSTMTDIDVQCRIFAIGSTAGGHPSLFVKTGLRGKVLGTDSEVNEESITITNASADQFHVFSKPFEFNNPPKDSTNHYCFISEFRHKRTCCPVWPGWPSDEWAQHATLADFHAYTLANPHMCWRNIHWVRGRPGAKSSSKCWEWSCSTNLVVPDCAHYSTFWSIIVGCDNEHIPPGCTWSLTCDDGEIFPNSVCFQHLPIDTHSPHAGCHFTGARAGYNAKVTLTLTWCDGGNRAKYPPPSVKFTLAETHCNTAPTTEFAQDAPAGSAQWPLYVTQKYPYIGDQPHPAPLPTFARAGHNTWPFAGARQFAIGEVCVTANPE